MDEITFTFTKIGKLWLLNVDDGVATSEHHHSSRNKAFNQFLYTLNLWKPGEKFTVTVRRE